MQLTIRKPGLDRGTELSLQRVHPVAQRDEARVTVARDMGPGDVRGIRAHFATGIDEEHLPVTHRALGLVVQKRGFLVQRDDRRVRQLGVRLSERLDERIVNIQLRSAGLERGFRRNVPLCAELARFVEALKLVVGLVAPIPVEPRHELFGIDG